MNIRRSIYLVLVALGLLGVAVPQLLAEKALAKKAAPAKKPPPKKVAAEPDSSDEEDAPLSQRAK